MHRSTIRPTTFSTTRPLTNPGPGAITGHLSFRDLEAIASTDVNERPCMARIINAVLTWWNAR